MKQREIKTRYRILWPRPEDKRGITHWIFAADMKRHGVILFGSAYFAVYDTGKMIKGYSRHTEFKFNDFNHS